MTDKVQKIREEVQRLQSELIQEKEKGFGSDIDDACILELQNVLTFIDSMGEDWPEPISPADVGFEALGRFWDEEVKKDSGELGHSVTKKSDQEEPVSEFMNIESMIESYKQRLISQANGVKNSPLIDMCLASYKHGINEILDTLNLSNVERTIKNWKESVSEDLEKASIIHSEIVRNTSVIDEDFIAGAKWQKEHFINSIWHNASEEPDNMSHCLIYYGCKESVGHYLHYEPVLYNKKEKMFVTSSFPHPTGYKVEQKSFDGGCVAEVYKDRRDRISISDITQWCYLYDLNNLSNLERTVKNWKEPVSEDLENAAIQYAGKHAPYDDAMDEVEEAFKAGAQWQKQKDKDKVLTDKQCKKIVDNAFELGKDAMKQQMMKKAIEGIVTTNIDGWINVMTGFIKPEEAGANFGNKVKLIIIKEE